MLCKDGDNFGTLPLKAARAWALGKNIPFLIGPDIIKAFQGFGARYYQGSEARSQPFESPKNINYFILDYYFKTGQGSIPFRNITNL